MSINAYIDSLTRIDQNKCVENVTWSKIVKEKKKPQPQAYRGKGVVPYQFEQAREQAGKNPSHQRDQRPYREKKTNSHGVNQDGEPNYGEHRFAEIIPSVREVGAGYNTNSNDAIERRFKERQAQYAATEKSDSSTTYLTANSKLTEDSFTTAAESLNKLKLSSDESKKEISVGDINEERYKKNALMSSENEISVGDINEERYKKNALITGLLQNEYLDFSNDTSTEHSSGLCNTSQDLDESDEDWDKEESDESMFKGRIIRFFQSAEDEDVFVHPLKEEIQKDPAWQKYRLKRKGVEVVQTPRQYFMNLGDDDFTFQPPNPQ